MAFIMASWLLATLSFATVTIGKVDCPVQFEGRVEEIIEGVSAGSAFSTQSVIFKNLATIKGEVQEQVAIQMLEHGPFQMERGGDYRVQLKNGHVCWIERI